MKADLLIRARRAARNALIDQSTSGWWRGGSREVGIPTRTRSGPRHFCFGSSGFFRYNSEFVHLGAAACATAKALTRATGRKPNNWRIIRAAWRVAFSMIDGAGDRWRYPEWPEPEFYFR